MSTATPPLPPNPSLLAILLVIRTKAGQPRLAFHYPLSSGITSTTQTAPPAHSSWFGGASTGAEGDDSSTEHSSDTDDDIHSDIASHVGSEVGQEEEKRSKSGSWKSRSKQHTIGSRSTVRPGGRRDIDDELEAGSGDEEDDDGLNSSDLPEGRSRNGSGTSRQLDWERVVGIEASALSKLLTPSRAFNKRRFEIGIDNLVFLGAPKFARDDGSWKKHRKAKAKPTKHTTDQSILKPLPLPSAAEDDSMVALPSGFEAGYGHGTDSKAASILGSSIPSEAASTSEDSDMAMFHVIFVMNPPALEYHLRIDDMYDHVVKWYAKLLKHEQTENALVWEESRKILAMKDKAKENGVS